MTIKNRILILITVTIFFSSFCAFAQNVSFVQNNVITKLTEKLRKKDIHNQMDKGFVELSKGVSIQTFTKISFGQKDGCIGYENSPDYTPYPESAQDFVIKGNKLYILDTFNFRVLCFNQQKNMLDLSIPGKWILNKTIKPRVDVQATYYSGMGVLSDNSIVAADIINRALIRFDESGELLSYYNDVQEWEDITAILPYKSKDKEYIVLGDKGHALKNIFVTDNKINVTRIISSPGLTEQGLFIQKGGDEQLSLTRLQQDGDIVNLFTYDLNDSKKEAEKKELKDLDFPTSGTIRCAGVDSKGNLYLYWAGLKPYLSKAGKKDLNTLTENMDASQIIAWFKVVNSVGKVIKSFTVPFSTAAEGAEIYEDQLYFMNYNAKTAPKEFFKICTVKIKN